MRTSLVPVHCRYYGHKAVAQSLLDAGVDITARNAYGETPRDVAGSRGHRALAELLDTAMYMKQYVPRVVVIPRVSLAHC